VDIRIYYEDTDCGGVVYYANYLRYFERARTEYLRDKGIDPGILDRKGIIFAVSKIEVDYLKSAKYNDIIHIVTQLKVGRASLRFFHTITRGEELIAKANCLLACVSSSGAPKGIPIYIKEAL